MENTGKSGSREQALSRLHSFISLNTFIGFDAWWVHLYLLALTTICYLTTLLVLLYFLFDNNQEQPNSRRRSARQRHIAKISLLPVDDRETISRIFL